MDRKQKHLTVLLKRIEYIEEEEEEEEEDLYTYTINM